MSTQPTDCGQTLLPAVPTDPLSRMSPIWDSRAVTSITTPTLPQIELSQAPATAEASDRLSKVLPVAFLAEEEGFYNQYSWSINAFPRLNDVVERLASELNKLDHVNGWHYSEVSTNIFLLSCAITDTIDDYLLGTVFDFSKLAKVLPFAGPAVRVAHKGLAWRSSTRLLFLARLVRWKQAWANAVTDFIEHALVKNTDRSSVLRQRDQLKELLPIRFGKTVGCLRPKIPAFFRSRDFATPDCLELARKFMIDFADSVRPAIVVGLRTAGSFLAPLTCAYLRANGTDARWIAIRPSKGITGSEQRELERAASRNCRALIADESVHSGQTLAKTITILRGAGFAEADIVVLNPVEPALPDWKSSRLLQSLPQTRVVSLEPAERYKCRVLDSISKVQGLLDEYFKARGYSDVRVVSGGEFERLNSSWRDQPPERVDHRLKRIYEVHLKNSNGSEEVRYVLAKSVGWGWLGYHSFIAGHRLAQWTAPILGLRDGILFSEWLPQEESYAFRSLDQTGVVNCLATYVAARAKHLWLKDDPALDLVTDDRHKGLELLSGHLIRAYGSRIVAAAKRPWLRRRLVGLNRFLPVMTDSRMTTGDWLSGDVPRKADFEHHCFGKNELGITDPAFDLATAMLEFGLSDVDSQRLVKRYIQESGDTKVEDRLFFNKFLAGIRAQSLADHDLTQPRLFSLRSEANRQYISAWNFLVKESIKECGKLCSKPKDVHWHTPLVVADIDGVLDRMVFGVPCTTAAGIKTLSLLHAHDFCIAVNTARTLTEVKRYCHEYSFAGGVAEYGAVVWDALSDRQRVLVDKDSLEQLERTREAFRRIPGCFLNEDYLYSLRIFTYQNGRTAPISALLAQDLLAELGADRLRIHHTGLDTAIVAKTTDKGVGLLALLDFVGLPKTDVAAIGDSEPDLAMFRVANRSFAPGNVTCRKEAELLGCSIARSSYQPGLLEIAKRIAHPDGSTCDRCKDIDRNWPKEKNLFISLIEAADQKPLFLLLRNLHSLSFLAPFKK